MTYYLNSYVRAVRGRLQEVEESEEIDIEDLQDSVRIAVRHHSQFSPQEIVADIDGAGSYDLTLPSGWDKNFSTILSVEYPQGNRTPTYLEPKDWTLYQGLTGNPVLRLFDATPAAGETVRVAYSLAHSVEANSSTIPDIDFWAVAHLAAAMAARRLAARYSRVWEPTLELDLINYRAKAAEYNAIADICEGLWRKHLNLPAEGAPSPAFEYGDWDIGYSWDRPLLVHKPRYR